MGNSGEKVLEEAVGFMGGYSEEGWEYMKESICIWMVIEDMTSRQVPLRTDDAEGRKEDLELIFERHKPDGE